METKKRCANCGTELAATSRFCSQCGEAQGDLRPRADTGLLPANRRLNGDRYLIVRKLAQGGQSAVYLALDTADGQRRAIKEMSESQLSQTERTKAVNDFLREASMLMRLSHPGLCRVYGTFIEDNRKPFLVMEYIEGHNLEDELIGRGWPLDWQNVTRWGMMLADVLAYLHTQDPPVIYRDLKPSNVMLTLAGAIKLIDFGIARQLFPQRLADTARLGTDGYAPVEQYIGRSEPRSDLYALGASLYHLLTGRVPEAAPVRYSGHTLTPIRALNAAVPEPLDRVIQQALRLNAQERFSNAFAMRQALEWAWQVSTTGEAKAVPSRNPASGAAPAAGQGRGYAYEQYGAGTGQQRVTRAPAIEQTLPQGGQTSVQPSAQLSGGPSPNGDGSAQRSPWSGRMSPDVRSVMPPRLRLWPLRVDAGLLEGNQMSTHLLELENRGGGELVGSIETNSGSITVDPAQFRANIAQLQIQVKTAGLAPGEYRFLVAVRTNGGDQIVPVSFMVRPDRAAPAPRWPHRRS
ncbi:MAG TPA: serine/threonine-protein kinase [Ktedonobacterales bacterium]